ncbi:hypothetical protein DHEL01_v211290 [Diaporthe helianthi]|uniref:Uncharacterized protein n=1 Tax=Diaporthe helianthi TaxID=158607 RepID=A0A2P5HJ92_DIAHE|nr:hypothetical protein DHEL01_v211290 [Diaporthe helianthi]
MVSLQTLYAAVLGFSALLPQATAHQRSATPGVPVIDARLVDASGRALHPEEIADLAGRTVDLMVIDHDTPSFTKRNDLEKRELILVSWYIVAASGADDVEAYADDMDGAE